MSLLTITMYLAFWRKYCSIDLYFSCFRVFLFFLFLRVFFFLSSNNKKKQTYKFFCLLWKLNLFPHNSRTDNDMHKNDLAIYKMLLLLGLYACMQGEVLHAWIECKSIITPDYTLNLIKRYCIACLHGCWWKISIHIPWIKYFALKKIGMPFFIINNTWFWQKWQRLWNIVM